MMMSKNYLFKVIHKITKDVEYVYGADYNSNTFLFFDTLFYWDEIDDYELYKEKNCETCAGKDYSCNLKDNNYCNDYDMWEEANKDD